MVRMSRPEPESNRSRALRTVERRLRAQSRRIRDAVRMLVDVRGRALARRRIAEIRSRHPGLASDLSALTREDGQRILLVSLSDEPQQARLEAILAKALQLHGARVTILTWRSARRSRTFFKAMRLRDIFFYDDVADATTSYLDEARRVLERCPTVQDLLHFEHRGVRVGRQALSTVVRTSHEPRVDLADPEVRESIVRTLVEKMDKFDDLDNPLYSNIQTFKEIEHGIETYAMVSAGAQ